MLHLCKKLVTPLVIKTSVIALLSLTGFQASVANASEAAKSDFKRPLHIPFPADVPYSPQMATLGKMLFFDPRLSGAENMNCASCHNPSFGYEVPVETAVGAGDRPLGRQAPTILNSAWIAPLFWDGRAATLEEQAAGPIEAPVEMNAKFEDIIPKLQDISGYAQWFDNLFPGEGVTRENILEAIATYERTVVSGWSSFDRWVEGDEKAISASAKRGFDLFVGKARCADCHTGWNMTDNKFHDIGVTSTDIGRGKYEPDNIKARYAFKTPGLRNIDYRAPFMHNGQFPDLTAVMKFYEKGGIDRPSRSDLMGPIELTDQERQDLVNFMLTLTADRTDVTMPILPN